MKIGNSIFCSVCCERCSIFKKKIFKGTQEYVIKTYSTMIDKSQNGHPTTEEHYCWECMVFMRGKAAKMALQRLEDKKSKEEKNDC